MLVLDGLQIFKNLNSPFACHIPVIMVLKKDYQISNTYEIQIQISPLCRMLDKTN